MTSKLTIPAGNAVEITVAWKDADGDPEIPTAVRYQVFNRDTGVAVSSIVTVGGLASAMEFTVPGANLPGPTVGVGTVAHLVIQIEGTFTAGDKHVEDVGVAVRRAYTFA